MGLYVHSGFEVFPRWWNKSWLTKWFITATFHDQHHRYFKGDYGGFTTIWDWICGTVRTTYLADYQKVTTRPLKPRLAAAGSNTGSEAAEEAAVDKDLEMAFGLAGRVAVVTGAGWDGRAP